MLREILVETLENAKLNLYQDTSMALDIICEELAKIGYDATFSGRSIYIGDIRVASVKTCVEAPLTVGIYEYKVLI